MSIVVGTGANEFYAGDDVYLQSKVRDYSGIYINPSNGVIISVFDRYGQTILSGTSMTASTTTTGIYSYIWTSPSSLTPGPYTVWFVASGEYRDTEKLPIKVLG